MKQSLRRNIKSEKKIETYWYLCIILHCLSLFFIQLIYLHSKRGGRLRLERNDWLSASGLEAKANKFINNTTTWTAKWHRTHMEPGAFPLQLDVKHFKHLPYLTGRQISVSVCLLWSLFDAFCRRRQIRTKYLYACSQSNRKQHQ